MGLSLRPLHQPVLSPIRMVCYSGPAERVGNTLKTTDENHICADVNYGAIPVLYARPILFLVASTTSWACDETTHNGRTVDKSSPL